MLVKSCPRPGTAWVGISACKHQQSCTACRADLAEASMDADTWMQTAWSATRARWRPTFRAQMSWCSPSLSSLAASRHALLCAHNTAMLSTFSIRSLAARGNVWHEADRLLQLLPLCTPRLLPSCAIQPGLSANKLTGSCYKLTASIVDAGQAAASDRGHAVLLPVAGVVREAASSPHHPQRSSQVRLHLVLPSACLPAELPTDCFTAQGCLKASNQRA